MQFVSIDYANFFHFHPSTESPKMYSTDPFSLLSWAKTLTSVYKASAGDVEARRYSEEEMRGR